jgi:hypothetical protein
MRNSIGHYRIPHEVDLNTPEGREQLNRILSEIHQRLGTVQQTGVPQPPAVQGLTAAGQQGCHYITWQRQVNVDGYIIIASTDNAQSKIYYRTTIPDGDAVSFSFPVGNVAQTLYWSVSAYRGNRMGVQSSIISSTSKTFTTSESAPAAAPLDPRLPLVSGVPRKGENIL